MIPRARDPFRFFVRTGLTLVTGVRARTVRELAGRLKEAPDSCVYQHTHRFLQEHQYLVPEPPNDFAYWATEMLQDEALGERLASIDTVQFRSLGELRGALLGMLEDHLRRNGEGRPAPPGKEFHFMRAVRFSVPTREVAHDLAEFGDCLRRVSLSSLYLHVFEARLRLPLGEANDFAVWFERELGEVELARRVGRLDPYAHTLQGLRARLLAMVRGRLKDLGHAPP
ncbi:MAG: DUF5752 family protein [Planctomycetota bacterium]